MRRLRGGNRVSLLECGRQFFPALIRAIDAARTEVHLETYIFARDPSGEAVAAALGRAAARSVAVRLVVDGFGGRDFVEQMSGQLEAPIAQGGTNVSGGQRQRLSIARSLVRRPHVYIFDDSFSALDVTTDARLRAALADETQNAAVVIVGQRVATIAGADQIIVLDDGHIDGIGTHEQLLQTCPTYAEIVESQFKAEEAA